MNIPLNVLFSGLNNSTSNMRFLSRPCSEDEKVEERNPKRILIDCCSFEFIDENNKLFFCYGEGLKEIKFILKKSDKEIIEQTLNKLRKEQIEIEVKLKHIQESIMRGERLIKEIKEFDK